uniref:PDEase domain-containing protein n=2 Tax=Phytophthora ramorum TaxID=164328 RepID=H3HCQ7_PHYRM
MAALARRSVGTGVGSSTPRALPTEVATSGDDVAVLSASLRATSVLETSSDNTSDESIIYAVALLRKLQQHACESERGEAAVQREQIDQILHGFSRALETVTSTWDERSVENTMQKLFDTHSNVFDESMQNFFIQNFLHESESAKTFRTALRRTSMLRSPDGSSASDDKGIAARRWGEAVTRVMKQKEDERRRYSIEVCPEVTNPSIVSAVKNEIANVDSWNFDVFTIATAVPGQAFTTFAVTFGQPKRAFNLCYGTEHAADVTQTLHHFLSVGNLGSLFTERTKCTALLAAIVHDVGHTSYSNNFHITINDELAVQYVYRSPLEHMHCALAFQLMKDPECNILQGLTKIEQQEVRNLITDMVLATDNSVHSAYLGKLDNLVRRSTEEGWKTADPDDDRLVLQMALHAADVSNPTKSLRTYLLWAERITHEFYQQGDKERELLLPVSIGYDREQPIPLEKMQAGFIIGIVRPLFSSLSRLPSARLAHCMAQLDANLAHWQDEINRNQPPKPAAAPDEAADEGDCTNKTADKMLSLVKKVATAAKPTARRTPAQSRLMSHGPAPPEGSLEAKVRHYLPEDYHIVLATLGAYTTLIMLFKLKPSKKKEEEIVIPASSNSTSTSVPSLFDDEFDEWSKLPGNLAKWEKSLETLGN